MIPALTRQACLKRRLRKHLATLGFNRAEDGALVFSGGGKETVRALHQEQRKERLARQARFISDRLPRALRHFASGDDVHPARIRPALERIFGDTPQADLFRLASLTWSVPVSNGFGRRLRYLVWDESNGKLLGILAIGDPVFNLSVRDNEIGWDVKQRSACLVNVMDAYVLGALPPYSQLLGGKLVACLLRTRDLYDDFQDAYASSKGLISGQQKSARLLAVTTSSSMGRSSLYARLKLGSVRYMRPIGYTSGWGHFHIPEDLFADMRAFLREINHPYADLHRFGQGPNWRLRTTREALKALGISEDILRHGVRREVFMCELASNTLDLLRGAAGSPEISTLLPAPEVSKLAVQRWILPRAERRPEYRAWSAESISNLLIGATSRSVQFSLAI